jgi:hypothetical protein
MNTRVTINVNPREFDLLREAVGATATSYEALYSQGSSADPKTKRTAREKAGELRVLEGKLNS